MKNLILMTAISFALFMARGITGPINSLYVESLGANYTIIGILGTVTSLTAILSSYLWGWIADRLERRKILLLIGLLILAICFALLSLAPSFHYLFPINILSAIAQAAYSVASLALMGDLLEKRQGARGRRMGTYRGLASLGFGLMAFIAGSIADRYSLRAPFGLAAVFFGIGCFLALLVQESHTPGSSTSQIPGPPAPLPSSPPTPRLPLPPLLISMFLWSLVTGAVYAVWANYMVTDIHFTQAQMSRLWAIASLSEFPLMILVGQLSDRIGRLPMLSLGFVAWTVVFLGYVVTPFMPWIVIIQLIRGFAYSAFTAASMTYATEVRARAERGKVSGFYTSAGSIGSILGSSMGGAMAQFSGFRPMILVNAGLIFAGSIYMAIVAIRHRSKTKS